MGERSADHIAEKVAALLSRRCGGYLDGLRTCCGRIRERAIVSALFRILQGGDQQQMLQDVLMMLNFALVDKDWESSLEQAMQAAHQSELMIVCPFIKAGTIKRLLKNRNPKRLLVLTRFKLRDFFDGVSDLEALRFLLHRGAEIRGLRHLHAKMYLCGAQKAIVTSANLTDSALRSNHEFGFVSDDKSIFDRCRDYFMSMWPRASSALQATQLDDWDKELAIARRSGPAPGMMPKLGDYGTDLGLGTPESTDLPMFPSLVAQPFAEGASAWHVKFFGTSSQRVLQTEMVLDVLRTDGAHWAGAYPKGKRPRSVQDGDVMFMAKMTRDPNDYLIYWRRVGGWRAARRPAAGCSGRGSVSRTAASWRCAVGRGGSLGARPEPLSAYGIQGGGVY